ncbi:MAG: hypothetical protein H7070_05590 [Saprospiraceae bacterium]|nr:hypothetical protein [Pyrinomonadaceae bacterium]
MIIRTRVLTVVIILTGFAAGCSKIPSIFDAGGMEFLVRVETDRPYKNEIIDLVIKITERRLNAVGISGEAVRIESSPDQMRVRVYGTQDWEAVKRFLFTTNELSFKKAVSPPNPSMPVSYTTEAEARTVLLPGQEVLPYSRSYENEPQRFLILEAKPLISGDDIRQADVHSYDGTDRNYQIGFSLTKDGAERFGEWTGRNINNHLAVVLDNEVVSVAFIRSQITDSGQITGSFTKAEAEELAMSLNSGHLPAKLTVLDERRR